MSSESCNSVNKFTTCNLKNSWCSLGETKETRLEKLMLNVSY